MGGKRRIRRRLTISVAMLLTATMTASSSADTITRNDPNDTKGELDIAAVRLVHRPSDVHEFRITTYQAFTNEDVGNEANFAISIDVNDRNPTDSRWKPEFWVYFWATRTGFKGVVWEPATDRVSRVSAARVSPRSARVLVPIGRIGSPDSYRFAAWSYTEQSPCTAKDPCVDAVPNRLPLLLHDYTPPPVTLRAPAISTNESMTLEFPVTFEISDDRYGSGVRQWTLQTKTSTAGTWTIVTTGGSAGSFDRQVPGIQGAMMQTRVVVEDRSGNTSTSAVRQTVVPFDDTDPSAGLTIAYGPGWAATTGDAARFLGTTHTATAATDASFTVDFTGTKACLQFERVGGAATATLDGDPVAFSRCLTGLAAGPHTVVVTFTGDAFTLDWVAIWP